MGFAGLQNCLEGAQAGYTEGCCSGEKEGRKNQATVACTGAEPTPEGACGKGSASQ